MFPPNGPGGGSLRDVRRKIGQASAMPPEAAPPAAPEPDGDEAEDSVTCPSCGATLRLKKTTTAEVANAPAAVPAPGGPPPEGL